MTTYTANALSETYLDTQNLIYKTIHSFLKKYGGDWDELLGEANLYFILAYNSHDPSKGDFTPRLRHYIWNNLLNTRRRILSHKAQLEQTYHTRLKIQSKFDYLEFEDSLSEDGRIIVDLLHHTPTELKNLLIEFGNTPLQSQRILKEYLSEFGWSRKKIKETFSEIKNLLND